MSDSGNKSYSGSKRKSVTDSTSTDDDISVMPPPLTPSLPPPSFVDNVSISEPTTQRNLIGSSLHPSTTGDASLSHQDKSLRSHVWEHYKKIYDSKGVETGRVTCIWCHRNYQGSTTLGTSGLWKHLRESCKKFPNRKDLVEAHKSKDKDKNQTTLIFNMPIDNEAGKFGFHHFDQEGCRKDLVRMIVIDEMPFRTVEKRGFKEFCARNLPEFRIPSRRTITRDCFSLFSIEKRKLKILINSQCQRVSFTTDTWTSIQNVSYMCLTAHFVDSEWCMQKKILNFCVIESHKGINLANAISSCMEEWGLSRIMCISVDNASANDVAIDKLKKKLIKKDALVLDGVSFHMRCCSHILNLIVKDGLQLVDGSIKRIRAVVKYIRGSAQRLSVFKRCCVLSDIKYTRAVCLDCPTRWNSTYLMLDIVLGYQKAFDKLEDIDKKYAEEFMNDILVESDWLNIKIFCRFLKKIYDITCKLSGSSYSTSSLYFPEVMKILKDIISCQNSKNASLKYMGTQMRTKFDKYWGSIDTINMMLFVAVVLDPRYKMKYLLVKYTEFYSESDAIELVGQVTKAIIALLDEYKVENTSGQMNFAAQCSGVDEDDMDDEIDDYFLNVEKDNVLTEGDWERYVNELPEKYVVDFDLLLWWKVNAVRYPALSKVAKDVFAIQCSTVASESAFSTGGRTLDRFRSSLTPITAAVLICCQDWLRTSTLAFKHEEELEDLDAIEEEVRTDPEVASSLTSIFQLDP